MGTCNWVGGSSLGTTNWSIAANWDTGVPTRNDDAVITSPSYACNLTMPSVCKSLSVESGFTAAFNTNLQPLSIYGNLSLNGGGVTTIDNTITIGASSVITVNVSVANITQASGTITLGGNLTCTGTFKIRPYYGGFSSGFNKNAGTETALVFNTNNFTFTYGTLTVDQS